MRRLILFGKRPRRGRVKTRLVPPLDPAGAAELYAAFLADQLAFVAGFRDRADVEWWTDGPAGPAASDPRPPAGVSVRLQGPGDLGRRLARVFARAAREGAACTVVVGADCPTLPATRIDDAFARLDAGAAAVVAPAEDGGYVLVGLREPRPELFRDVPWGGPDVLAVTRDRASDAGVQLVELDPWYDVDDEAGLRKLLVAAAGPARRRAPATCARLLDWRETGVI